MVTRREQPFDGAYYHTVLRGNNRNYILKENRDKQHFKSLLLRYQKESVFEIFHYCIMDNHIHLVIHLLESNRLSKVMQGLSQSYTNYWKRTRGFEGCLWHVPYRRFLIETSQYLLECGRYIECNPVRAGMVRHPADYTWSSYRAYAEEVKDELITCDPEFLALAQEPALRQKIYKSYVASVRPYENMLDVAIATHTMRKVNPWARLSETSGLKHP